MSRIHVIIAVHNRIKITQKFIALLQNQTFRNIHLVVIEDGSNDGTFEMVSSANLDKTIIRGKGDLWWGGALHQAYLWLTGNHIDEGDFVLVANDDIEIESTFIEKGVDILSGATNTLLTANGYGIQSGEHKDGAIYFNFINGRSKIADSREEANCASTHALFLRVKDFLKIGGFHPVLLPHYGSDYEFTIRAWRKGFKIISKPDLKYFFNEESTGNMYYLDLKPGSFIKKMFSKKSVYNPIYKFTFILLACPLRYIPVNIFFQIIRYFNNVILYIKRSIKT